MAFRKVVPRLVQDPIIDNITSVLKNFSMAWKGTDYCPYIFFEKDGHLVAKDKDGGEYIIIMGVINHG